MIVFDLKCAQEHVFEVWFADFDSCNSQISGGEVACPICGDSKVAKAPMAPNIPAGTGRGRGRGTNSISAKTANTTPKSEMAPPTPEQMGEAINTLRKMRDVVEKNFDNVGDHFPEEARKIHHGEVAKRNIYGDASSEDVEELREEGIEVSQMPWVTRHDS